MADVKVTIRQNGLKMEASVEDAALAVKTYRLRRGLTQKQLGDEWGMSRHTIMRVECGRKVSWEMTYKVFALLSKGLETEGKV